MIKATMATSTQAPVTASRICMEVLIRFFFLPSLVFPFSFLPFFFLPSSSSSGLGASKYRVEASSVKYLYSKITLGLRLNSSMSLSISEADW